MSEETYFRGETSNHQPARSGQYQMDYGDGLYLTSDKKTAEVYALKRVNEKGGVPVVTQVTIKPGELGKVLDLTTDGRWAKFMNTPMVPGKNDTTPRALMRIQQNNFALFQQFLKQNRIDISHYDAVKGPELTHGGTQIVILHKNGAPSAIAAQIRARLTVPGGISPTAQKVQPGRIAMTVRSVGGGLVMIGVGILAAILRAKVDQRWIEKGLKELEPEIMAALGKRVPLVADVMAKGKKAYANVTIEIIQRKEAAAGIDFIDSMPLVKLAFVDVTAENSNAQGVVRVDSGFGYTKTIRPVMFSFEVSVAPETVKVWKEFADEWEWYENQLNKAPSTALRQQQETFHKEIVLVFGTEADLVLKAWMWPKFKFKTA